MVNNSMLSPCDKVWSSVLSSLSSCRMRHAIGPGFASPHESPHGQDVALQCAVPSCARRLARRYYHSNLDRSFSRANKIKTVAAHRALTRFMDAEEEQKPRRTSGCCGTLSTWLVDPLTARLQACFAIATPLVCLSAQRFVISRR